MIFELNEEQRIVREQARRFAITEPDSGSDVAGMKTTARDKGDHWELKGRKTWISNAPVGDVGLVYAFTDREKKYRGMTCFIVDLKNTSGITTAAIACGHQPNR